MHIKLFAPSVGGPGLLIFVMFQAWAVYFAAGCTPRNGVKVFLAYFVGIVASIGVVEISKLLTTAGLTGDWPVASYWRPTVIRADTRLPAFGASTTEYRFVRPVSGGRVSARLVFRRLFEPIADRYEWDVDDLVIAEDEVLLDPS